MPITLLILVSWFTFFLRDYKHRIEVTSGNLLVYIAFSFSIAGNYPRLGYLTFLDAIMAVMFVITALVVVYNVSMKRLELAGQGALVQRIDNIMGLDLPPAVYQHAGCPWSWLSSSCPWRNRISGSTRQFE